MSHPATKWAMRQRGLKPATKIVLWCLADHHNAATGDCFPMQETIAAECEMSRSTVNLHLAALEERGLIRRSTAMDDRTKRQRPTRYVLMLDAQAVYEIRTQTMSENETRAVSELVSDFPEPCPKNGESRVRNSDSNLGREPSVAVAAGGVREPALFNRVLHAVGLNPNDRLPTHWMPPTAEMHVQRWVAAGIPPEVVVEIATESRKRHRDPPDRPTALDRAMRAWLTARSAPAFTAPVIPLETGSPDARRPSRQSRGDATLDAFLSGARG